MYFYWLLKRQKEKNEKNTPSVKSHLFLADVMSDPQIGVQIGEIHNENTGGGNVQNSTASVPGSGYPLVSLSLLFIQLVCVFFQ